MTRLALSILYTPPILFLLCLIPPIVILASQKSLDEITAFSTYAPWQWILGGILTILGLTLATMSLLAFWKHHISPLPFSIKKVPIIKNGIYARSRNPMYISLLILYVACTIMLCPLFTIFGCVLLAWLLTFEIKREEQVLSSLCPEYLEYYRHVPRWL